MVRLLQHCRFTTANAQGFSLLELMVSISIIVLITSIALVQNSSFNNTVLLTNQAYEFALDIRQAQLLGVSVQVGAGPGDEVNRRPIGVSAAMGEQSYTVFRDNDDSDTLSESSEEIQQFTLDNRFEIISICNLDETLCANDTQTGVVLFQRPDFTARFTINGGAVSGGLRITLGAINGGGDTKTLVVEDTGLISVQ